VTDAESSGNKIAVPKYPVTHVHACSPSYTNEELEIAVDSETVCHLLVDHSYDCSKMTLLSITKVKFK